MDSLNLYPLDAVTLRDWLVEQKQAGVSAGKSCDDTDCPLSRFLSFLYGSSFVVHFADYERLDHDVLHEIDERTPLPEWAERFVYLVDWAAGCNVKPVPASAALLHLRQACHEYGVSLEVGI